MSSKKVVIAWELHPACDHMLPLAFALLAYCRLSETLTSDVTKSLLNAAVTFGGVALTACAFAATMIYTSSDQYVQSIRRSSRVSLTRNWMSILRMLSAASALAGLSLIFADGHSRLLGSIAIYLISVSLLKVMRGLYFLRRIFILDGM